METNFTTPAGGQIKLDTDSDLCLYEAPRRPSGTRGYETGQDLYMHRERFSGTKYFYLYSWSLMELEKKSVRVISEAEAQGFAISKAKLRGAAALVGKYNERVLNLWPRIFDGIDWDEE